jgi:hypothetical protein
MPSHNNSGLTMTNVEHQSRQMRDKETQRRPSVEVSFGRFFTAHGSIPIRWGSAKFSSWRSTRERMIDRKVTSSAMTEVGIEGANSKRSITRVDSDLCGFRDAQSPRKLA